MSLIKNPETVPIPPQAYALYDQYAHGQIDRRQFVSSLSGLVGAAATAGLLGALLPNYSLAEQVSFNDPTIIAEYKEFDSPQGHGKGRGYLVYPRELKEKVPAVLVVHENRGLNPYIEDVARRLAKAGFVAFAPDALFTVGGYPGNDDTGRTLQTNLNPEKINQDFFAAARFLKTLDKNSGKVGVVGFCFGGAMANRLAVELPDIINAAVPFYGSAPDLAKVAQIKAPLLIHMGELDQRINDQWPAYEEALKKHKVQYQAFIYPKANHGFHNDSTPRYDAKAAELAWARTVEFFNKNLR
jgi:carboxymethylenebutenolidase